MSRKLFKVAVAPAKVAGVLREAMPIGDESDPVEAAAYFDSVRNLRRITAKYASGWSIRININGRGEITSRSANLKLETQAA